MKNWTTGSSRENTIILMAANCGYYFDGFSSEGYKVYTIYNSVNPIGRIFREVCFRIKGMPKKIWYNKEILWTVPQYIIVMDALVTKEYLKWLLASFPNAMIVYIYNNMVGNARHLKPNNIPDSINIWTYDEYDSKKYNIALKKTSPYFPFFVKDKKEIKYDLFFVGRDKGRGEMLLKFEKWLKGRGIKTNFIITKYDKLSKNKSYYKKEITYDKTVEIISQSRAILNVAMKNQRGITLRDLECLFNKVKLVTTNKYIKNADFYNKNNVFILGEDNLEKLPEFILSEYDDSIPTNMNLYSAEAMVREVTGNCKQK